MRRYSTIIFSLILSLSAWSVPATREPIFRLLNDGRCDTVYLHGDEYFHYTTDSRGEIIEPGLRKMAQYGGLRHEAPQRVMLNSYVPKTGKVRIPVILVNFTDLSFSLADAKTQFDDMFNGSGGSNPSATGSVHDYYTASSDSLLDLEYHVFGIYTLSQPMAYYGANKTNSSGEVTSHNIRAKELVKEAVSLALADGVDLSPFDNDNDGYIDNISIVVAGYNEAEGGAENTIWPHYSTINNSGSYDGKYLSGYLMISEYRSSGGKIQAGIGTYCHEFGHALGLPDLYDTSDNDAYTVGTWDIMCSGSYNNNGSTPPTFTAFERFALGWLTPQQVTTSGLYTLEPIESSNKALLIAAGTHNINAMSPSPNEYFLMENRQETGWDAGKGALVAPGLLVSHITFDKTKWDYNTFNNSKPLGFAIESAGLKSPTQSSDADVFPGSMLRTSWEPTLNDGTILNDLKVSQIYQRKDLNITMQIGVTGDMPIHFSTSEISMDSPYHDQIVSHDTARALLHLNALTHDLLQLYVSSQGFTYSPDSGKTWYGYGETAWIDIIQDSVYSIELQMLYHPSRQNCSYSYAFLTAATADESIGTQLTLAGRAPRPTYITTPVIDSVTQVSSNSLTVHWQPQEDADFFYYMLYTLGEGGSQENEEFESFSTIAEIEESGWSANFAQSQSTISYSGNAVLFSKSDTYIQSPKYLYAPTEISFWLSNSYIPNGTDTETGGTIALEGRKEGAEWHTVSRIQIMRTTKNVIRTITLDTVQQYTQFRLIYSHIGGGGGTVVDHWSAHFAQDIQYLYRLKEKYVYGINKTLMFRDLEPNTTYYYAMQAYDEKGCEPHYSSLCAPIAIRTKPDPEGMPLIVRRTDKGQYSIVLPEMADGKHTIGIYTETGRLYYSLRPSYGTSEVALPALPIGQLFLVKYYHERLKRSDLNIKILSN